MGFLHTTERGSAAFLVYGPAAQELLARIIVAILRVAVFTLPTRTMYLLNTPSPGGTLRRHGRRDTLTTACVCVRAYIRVVSRYAPYG